MTEEKFFFFPTDHIDRIKATKNTKKKGDARRDISIEKENEPGLL